MIEGYWNDHFGDARNRSAVHCHGQWILTVDADETLECDPSQVAAQLRATTATSLLTEVKNFRDAYTGSSGSLLSVRWSRRAATVWTGRLHEQQVNRDGSAGPFQSLPGVRLLHYGYTPDRMLSRDKGTRNRALSELGANDRDGSGLPLAEQLMNVVRSRALAQDAQGALEVAEEVLAHRPGGAALRSTCSTAARCAGLLGRFDEAWEWIARLREGSRSPLLADRVAVELLAAQGRWHECVEMIERLPVSAFDDDGDEVRRDSALEVEMRALVALGRPADAADRVAACYSQEVLAVGAANAVLIFRAAGRTLDELVASVPESRWLAFLGQLPHLDVADATELLDACWSRSGPVPSVLAAAAGEAVRFALPDALTWSARLRAAGLVDRCPLAAIARDDARAPRDRVLAAGLAIEAFGDDGLLPVLAAAAALVPDEQSQEVLDELAVVAPTVAQLASA